MKEKEDNHLWPVYITEKQVAVLTSIAVKTLQGMRIKGTGIPFIKVGRLVRYDIETVHKFMNEHIKKSTVDGFQLDNNKKDLEQ